VELLVLKPEYVVVYGLGLEVIG